MKRPLLLTLLAIPLAAAAPFQSATIPANAQWYLHGDLTKLRETTSGETLIKEIRKSEGDKLKDIENVFGLDILSDLTDVTLFGDGKKDHAAIMLSGKIEKAHLLEIIANADDYETSTHSSSTIHQWSDGGKKQHAAFHGEKTVVISNQKNLVSLTIDVLTKNKPSLELEKALPSEDPIIVAFAKLSEIDMPIEEGSKIIRKADSLLITLGETNERLIADMVIETKSEKTASQMMHVLEGLVSFGELFEGKIEGLDIQHRGKTEGKTMSLSLDLSVAKALVLLSELK